MKTKNMKSEHNARSKISRICALGDCSWPYMLFSIFIMALMIMIVPSVSSRQAPLPIEDKVKTGTPQFTHVTNNLINSDRGAYTREAFADMDADGDYDLFVGRDNGMIEYWENTGNETNASWSLSNSDLVGDAGSYTSPSVIDFDNDGDFDLLTGASDGWIRYYENTGSTTAFSFTYKGAYWDVGGWAAPEFMDYNRDGYYDIIYGRDNRYIYYYKNDVLETGIFFDDFAMDDVGSYSAPAYADIDNDGDYDLIVGNSAGQVYFYENLGSSTTPLWAEEEFMFDVGSYADPYLADFDNDQDLDLLIGTEDGRFTYYRNDGTLSTPLWTEVVDWFTSDVGDHASPSAADIDNDGDLDLFLGNSNGVVAYYENVGTPEAAQFTLITTGIIPDVGDRSRPAMVDLNDDGVIDMAVARSDGYILYYLNNGTAESYDFVRDPDTPNIIGDSYDYASPTFADIDDDGDLDLAYGTGGDQGWVVFRENKGNATNPSFETKNSWWLDNTGTGGAHDFVDFDGDGDLDLIRGSDNGYIYYYRNDGDADKPNFVYVRNWMDVGSWSAPTLADMDNDGDADMIVGRSDDDNLDYYMNDGSESSFEFEQITTDYQQIGDIGSYTTSSFVDIDADGDLDMFAGRDNGYIYYFRNDGAPDFANFTLVSSNMVGDYGDWSTTDFGDIDNDGDYDMVVGYNNRPTISYFRNDGNSTDMNFTFVTNNFLGGECYSGNGYNYGDPNFADMDNDGDLDMICSNYYYGPYYWRNDGSPDVPSWNPIGPLVGDPGDRQSVDVADIDGDGDYDMIFAEVNGNVYFYKNTGTKESFSFTRVIGGNNGYQWFPDQGDGFYPSPTMADLDNDGDMDMVMGRNNGYFHYYENHGIYDTARELGDNPTWIQMSSNMLGAACTANTGYGGQHCTPDLGDLDNDGDYDLVSGARYGRIQAWKNTGTKEDPQWTSWMEVRGDSWDHTTPALGDIDADGDLDIVYGTYDGYIQLYKNVGTPDSPSWRYIQAGDLGYQWYPDQGTHVQVDLFDYDGDGLTDMSYQNNVGDLAMLKNKGIYPTEKQRSDNPTWESQGTIIDMFGDDNYYRNTPSVGDLDGDGDLDLVIGLRYGQMRYWRNDGSQDNPVWVDKGDLGDVGNWGGAALADIDGDGDLDLFGGDEGGFIDFWRNTGTYTTATLVTVKDASNDAVINATVEFSDGSGVVCTELTNNDGQADCKVNYVGDSGTITVTNTVPGSVDVLIASPNSDGSSYMTLENPSNNFKIELEKFQFQTFSKDYAPNDMKVEVSDQGKVVMSKVSENGYIDAFFPKKYLKNMQEAFTQNRITYDIKLYENDEYASPLQLQDIYVPNEINFSSDTEQRKLFKFLATHEMSTDAEYVGYIIYPALKAQRKYNVTDTVPSDFEYTGNVSAEYLDYVCSYSINGTNEYGIDYTTPGCGFFGIGVVDDLDWFKVKFKVRSPSLDLFITNGWTTQDYQVPAANLKLIS